jgi:hypothetical protein
MLSAHIKMEYKKQIRKETVLHRNKCDNCWPLVEKIQIPAKAVNVMNHTNQAMKRKGQKKKNVISGEGNYRTQ